MILVLGSSFDDEPSLLTACLAEQDARLVTPRDLSKPGWRLRHGRAAQLQAAVGDEVVPASAIDGVVTLLPCVSVADLQHVVERDRAYVANEMTAFLLAWLTQLECPVVDGPSARSLSGCGRWPLEWHTLAKTLGVRSQAATARGGDLAAGKPMARVTVVGGCAVSGDGAGDPARAASAEAIARAAGCDLVTLLFSEDGDGPLFAGATIRPHVGSQAIADALRARLLAQ